MLKLSAKTKQWNQIDSNQLKIIPYALRAHTRRKKPLIDTSMWHVCTVRIYSYLIKKRNKALKRIGHAIQKWMEYFAPKAAAATTTTKTVNTQMSAIMNKLEIANHGRDQWNRFLIRLFLFFILNWHINYFEQRNSNKNDQYPNRDYLI